MILKLEKIKIPEGCMNDYVIDENIQEMQKLYLETIKDLAMYPIFIEANEKELKGADEEKKKSILDNIEKVKLNKKNNDHNKIYYESMILYLNDLLDGDY